MTREQRAPELYKKRLARFYRNGPLSNDFGRFVTSQLGPHVERGAPVVMPDRVAQEFYEHAYQHATHPGVVSKGQRLPFASEISATVNPQTDELVMSGRQLEKIQRVFNELERRHNANPGLVRYLKADFKAKTIGVTKTVRGIQQLQGLLQGSIKEQLMGALAFGAQVSNRQLVELALKEVERTHPGNKRVKHAVRSVREGLKAVLARNPSKKTNADLNALRGIHGIRFPEVRRNLIQFLSPPTGPEKVDWHTHPSATGHPTQIVASQNDGALFLDQAIRHGQSARKFVVMGFPMQPALEHLKEGKKIDGKKAEEIARQAIEQQGIIGFEYTVAPVIMNCFGKRMAMPYVTMRPIVTASTWEKQGPTVKLPPKTVPQFMKLKRAIIE